MKKLRENIYAFTKNGDNAYLITGGVNVLIDGVREEYSDEYIADIETVLPIGNISYIVINHCEPNRTGTLNAVLLKNPDITVIASTAGLKFLGELTAFGFNKMLAKDNAKISVNGKSMRFILTPYINWPDSMITVYGDSLFSCDLFSSTMLGPGDYYKKYLKTHSDYVRAALDEIKTLGISAIYCGTGLMITQSASEFIEKYSRLTDCENGKALLLYHSVYGNTHAMADVVEAELKAKNISYEIHDIGAGLYNELADKINRCRALIIGTDTINSDAPEDLWAIFARVDKVINKHKPCMLFGSYAWGGEGLYFMENHLKMLRYKIFEKPFGIVLKMSDDERQNLAEYTQKFLTQIE